MVRVQKLIRRPPAITGGFGATLSPGEVEELYRCSPHLGEAGFILPLEIAAALLLAAIIGAIVLVREK